MNMLVKDSNVENEGFKQQLVLQGKLSELEIAYAFYRSQRSENIAIQEHITYRQVFNL